MSLLGSEPEGRTSTDFLTSAEQQRVKQITKHQQLNSKPDKPQTTQSFKNNPQETTHTSKKKKTPLWWQTLSFIPSCCLLDQSAAVSHTCLLNQPHTPAAHHTQSVTTEQYSTGSEQYVQGQLEKVPRKF